LTTAEVEKFKGRLGCLNMDVAAWVPLFLIVVDLDLCSTKAVAEFEKLELGKSTRDLI
jgi:hypothetical protein